MKNIKRSGCEMRNGGAIIFSHRQAVCIQSHERGNNSRKPVKAVQCNSVIGGCGLIAVLCQPKRITTKIVLTRIEVATCISSSFFFSSISSI